MAQVSSVRKTGIDNVFFLETDDGELLATLSAHKDRQACLYQGSIYRLWSPVTSKLASMILKGMALPLRKDSKVLYLGAASGTTVSHVSDIVSDGVVFAVEFAPRPAKDLLKAIEDRTNVIPVIADARAPEKYPPFIESVDMIYQDIAQPWQSRIAIANAGRYLRKGGSLVMSLKLKSVSISMKNEEIARQELDELTTAFTVQKVISLEPFHRDHLAVLAEYGS